MNTFKKTIIFIVLLQISFAAGYAQSSNHGFIFLDDKINYQRPMSMVEFENAYIILCQYSFKQKAYQDYDYLIKINKNGTKINEVKIKTSDHKNMKGCVNLVKLNDTEFAVLGTIEADTLNPDIYDFFYATYTSDLEQILVWQSPKPYGGLDFSNAFLNSAGNIILHGALRPVNASSNNWDHYATIVEFATDGHVVNTYFNPILSPIGRIWHMQEYNNNYLAVQTCILENAEGQYKNVTFCRYSKEDLQVLHPYFEVDENVVPLAYAGHIIPANDTAFLLIGRALIRAKSNENALEMIHVSAARPNIHRNKNEVRTTFLLGLAHLDTACQLQGQVEHYAHFSSGDSYPGFWQSADIDKTNANIFYSSGVSPMSLQHYSSFPNTIWTYKFNTFGEEQWVVKYREPNDSAYFINYSVYSTTDGGLMLLNQRYNFNPNKDMDVHIIKYDSDGQLAVHNNEMPHTKVQVYPNPATSELHIDIPMYHGQPYRLQIHDICGRLIKETTLYNANNTIDISQWSSGVYTYSLQQAQHTTVHGKWIKR